MKRVLASSLVFAILSSISPTIKHNQVYAQERTVEQSALEDIASRVNFDYSDERFFFPNWFLDNETSDVLRIFDGILRDTPENNEARLQRALINYNKFNDKLGAKEDFEYLSEHGVEGLSRYIESANSLDGRITGRITNNSGDGLEGFAALFDGYRWTFNYVRNGEFRLGYNHARLKQNTHLPVYLFARGREPAHVKVTIGENSNNSLGDVVLKQSNLGEYIKILGCAYTFFGETPEDLTYGLILEGDKYLSLNKDIKRLKTNQNGFYSLNVPRRWIEDPIVTFSTGILLVNKEVNYKHRQ